MIKQTWNIDDSERLRILQLHESATKKLYLIKEQEEKKSWGLCGYIISEQGGKYFVDGGKGGQTLEIPKLSEVQGVIENGDIVFDGPTLNGIELGEEISLGECRPPRPMQYAGRDSWFLYFDDLETNKPIYGALGWKGKLGTNGGDFIGQKIPKDKNGVVILFQKKRSVSFIIEVSPAMEGTPIVERKDEITPIPPKTETVELNVESPFVYDKTTLTPEADKQFKKFIEDVKKNYKGVKGNVEVITSASIDGSGKEQYDMNLSTRRADAIIELLKSSLSDMSLTFVPKPIGQTDQFAPGKTYKNGFKPNETAPNRRLIIKLPKITREVK